MRTVHLVLWFVFTFSVGRICGQSTPQRNTTVTEDKRPTVQPVTLQAWTAGPVLPPSLGGHCQRFVCVLNGSFTSRVFFNTERGPPFTWSSEPRCKDPAPDLFIDYKGNVISLRSLARRVRRIHLQAPNETDLMNAVYALQNRRASSCRDRCWIKERNKERVVCFCDDHCSLFKDCCYDLLWSCPSVANNAHPNILRLQTCERVKSQNDRVYGEAMINTCSTSQDTAARCVSDNSTFDPQGGELPVLDPTANLTYRSVACAGCNNITEFTPWTLNTSCSLSSDGLNRFQCEWHYTAPAGIINRNCVLKMDYSPPAWKDGPVAIACELCNSYAMVFWFQQKYYRNPHCVLCLLKARDKNAGDVLPPSLNILFEHGPMESLPSSLPTVLPSNHSNRTEKQTDRRTTSTGLGAQRVVTMVGCYVSIVALLVLIVVYALFKELRNLPGKALMNLACSIICYQALFLSAGQTGARAVCVAIAVLLHYFLMVSFMWMAVMGYDLAKTFTSKGIGVGGRNTNNIKTLVIYCCFAWGGPLVLVAVCFTLDVTGAAYFGYGLGESCFIHNGRASLFALGIPIALAMLFNIVALVRTLIAIYREKKATARVATQSLQPSLAFMCVKLTVLLGVPWVLGFVAKYALLLRYIYIISNAFQGFFISLVFLTNKRVLSLMRSKFCPLKTVEQTLMATNITMREI